MQTTKSASELFFSEFNTLKNDVETNLIFLLKNIERKQDLKEDQQFLHIQYSIEAVVRNLAKGREKLSLSLEKLNLKKLPKEKFAELANLVLSFCQETENKLLKLNHEICSYIVNLNRHSFEHFRPCFDILKPESFEKDARTNISVFVMSNGLSPLSHFCTNRINFYKYFDDLYKLNWGRLYIQEELFHYFLNNRPLEHYHTIVRSLCEDYWALEEKQKKSYHHSNLYSLKEIEAISIQILTMNALDVLQRFSTSTLSHFKEIVSNNFTLTPKNFDSLEHQIQNYTVSFKTAYEEIQKTGEELKLNFQRSVEKRDTVRLEIIDLLKNQFKVPTLQKIRRIKEENKKSPEWIVSRNKKKMWGISDKAGTETKNLLFKANQHLQKLNPYLRFNLNEATANENRDVYSLPLELSFLVLKQSGNTIIPFSSLDDFDEEYSYKSIPILSCFGYEPKENRYLSLLLKDKADLFHASLTGLKSHNSEEDFLQSDVVPDMFPLEVLDALTQTGLGWKERKEVQHLISLFYQLFLYELRLTEQDNLWKFVYAHITTGEFGVYPTESETLLSSAIYFGAKELDKLLSKDTNSFATLTSIKMWSLFALTHKPYWLEFNSKATGIKAGRSTQEAESRLVKLAKPLFSRYCSDTLIITNALDQFPLAHYREILFENLSKKDFIEAVADKNAQVHYQFLKTFKKEKIYLSKELLDKLFQKETDEDPFKEIEEQELPLDLKKVVEASLIGFEDLCDVKKAFTLRRYEQYITRKHLTLKLDDKTRLVSYHKHLVKSIYSRTSTINIDLGSLFNEAKEVFFNLLAEMNNYSFTEIARLNSKQEAENHRTFKSSGYKGKISSFNVNLDPEQIIDIYEHYQSAKEEFKNVMPVLYQGVSDEREPINHCIAHFLIEFEKQKQTIFDQFKYLRELVFGTDYAEYQEKTGELPIENKKEMQRKTDLAYFLPEQVQRNISDFLTFGKKNKYNLLAGVEKSNFIKAPKDVQKISLNEDLVSIAAYHQIYSNKTANEVQIAYRNVDMLIKQYIANLVALDGYSFDQSFDFYNENGI